MVGASGVGKTAAVERLDSIPDFAGGCYFFDSLGVPPLEELQRMEESGESEDFVDDMIWFTPVTPLTRKARVHAFDLELSVFAGFLYTRAGFSPGEFLDFLLGWVGIDIAGDDVELEEADTLEKDDARKQDEAGE